MNFKYFPLLLLFFISNKNKPDLTDTLHKTVAEITINHTKAKADTVYNALEVENISLPQSESFKTAISGFYELKSKGLVTKNILTIIDFSLSSTVKRLWVIDLNTNSVLFHSLVSHGINSGLEFANSFSNSHSSNKSSLGFFATAETYNGKHGLSLKLDGLEKGINDKARSRGLVFHGAYYANASILFTQNYLGRSQGCPALPQFLNPKIINVIKGKSCIYIHHSSRKSKVLSKLMS